MNALDAVIEGLSDRASTFWGCLLAVVIVLGFWWYLGAAGDCSARHGALVESATGYSCVKTVPEQP